jgi:hypothetical protein
MPIPLYPMPSFSTVLRFYLASKNEYQVNPEGKGGRCVRLTTYHLHVPMSRNLVALTSWNPVGLFRPVMGQFYLYLYLVVPCLHSSRVFIHAPYWWQKNGQAGQSNRTAAALLFKKKLS